MTKRRTRAAAVLLAASFLLLSACSSGSDADPQDDGTATDGITTDGAATDGTTTDGSATDGTTTDGTATDGISTDGAATDGTTTDGSATDGTTADGSATDGTTTDGSATDGTTTDGAATDGTTTDGAATDGTTTDGAVTDGTTTDGAATDGTTTDGAVTDGTTTDGAATDGTTTDGTTTDGTTTNGSATDGTTTNGTTTNGTTTDGTTTNGTTTNGTTTNGTTTNGTTTNGTTTNGTTTNGTTTNGTTTNGTTTNGTTTNGTTTDGTTTNGSTTDGTTTNGSTTDGTPPVSNSVFVPDPTDITDVDAFYDRDGYDTVDVIRVDVRTVTNPGICTIDDQSGCTLADVIADIDPDDDFKVEIPIHFQSSDFADDGSESNATLRQRGGTARSYPQKSFRIKLDSKDVLWRDERRLQLNKHPNEHERIRNKLAFDLMRELPHLPSLRSQFVNLWIDDGDGPEDYGLFTHIEFAGKEYLVNRDLDNDDNLYKVEFLNFSQGDLDNLQVDADGKPLDKDRFESRLEIERGEDHRPLVRMLTALNDPSQSFESVLDRYFNANNVLMWITANFLLHQTDAVTHNFYLYNPVGSEKLYFLPWDYDDAFNPESVLNNSYDNNELGKRLFYGYARGSNSNFVARYYQLPGIHEKILAAADELRNTWLTDSNITERAVRYAEVVNPILSQSPDIDLNPKYNIDATRSFADFVNSIHESMQNDFAVPVPPKLLKPEVTAAETTFSWTPAFVVPEGNDLSYDLEVASSVRFGANSIVLSVAAIEDAEGTVSYSVDTSTLPSGRLFVRLTARASSDPQRFWQVAENTLNSAGTTWFGVIAFTVP